MKIIILHWHAICPHCKELWCIYADFYEYEDGTKIPEGFQCGKCGEHITNEEFDRMKKFEMACPLEENLPVKS